MKNDRRGTWPQAIWALIWPVVLILGVRWALVEPYVIPSESMLPNLLVSDHILVQKFPYGLRIPFSDRWLLRWGEPQVGESLVFRYPQNPSIFYIKRLIGRPGDEIQVRDGRITVNGQDWKLEIASEDELATEYIESGSRETHRVRFENPVSRTDSEPETWTVPEGHFFLMGDNRHNSSDSRVWGFVPQENLIGRAWIIWLSCEEMLESAPFLCDPSTLRWNRLLTRGGL